MENSEQNLPGTNGFNENAEILNESLSIPVITEQVIINKQLVETGKIKITKKIDESNEMVTVPLIREEIDIRRIPVNQYVDTMPEAVRYDGDTMIIPVLKEVSVVRTLLVEEVHITKKRVESQDFQNITLRKENVTIENIQVDPERDPY